MAQVREGNVSAISAKGTAIEGTFKQDVRYPDAEATATTDFKTEELPEFANRDELDRLLEANGVKVEAEPTSSETPLWLTGRIYVGPTLLIFAFFYWYMRRAAGGADSMFTSFGRAKAKPSTRRPRKKVTFTQTSRESRRPSRSWPRWSTSSAIRASTGSSGRGSRSVLLSSAPGRGRRCWHARSQAGGVAFFSMSASEFVEMIVGVGASRVRDLFAQAKAAAPSIVFVDEIDAIGKVTAAGCSSGANDEREQTLSQILTEMDGFDALDRSDRARGGQQTRRARPGAAAARAIRPARHDPAAGQEWSRADPLRVPPAPSRALTSVGMLTPGADPVRKISIIPRSRSLGVTVSAPATDQFSYDKRG